MKTIWICALLIACCACEREKEECQDAFVGTDQSNGFDQALADSLGADEYGMHQYVMAILKSGPNKPPSRQVSDSLFRGHMDNIQRLAEEGKLVLAGPFLADSNFRGIYIFDVKTVEEAQALTNTDPAIQYGSLVMELKPWYGSAALKEVNGLHKRVAQKEV